MERRTSGLSGLTIVVGCGRLGRLVATEVSTRGAPVVVIDRTQAQLDELSTSFSGSRLRGDASRLAVLREGGVDGASRLFALTSDDDVNLFVAQAALRLFQVPWVRARTNDPSRAPVYQELGIPVVDPMALGALALVADEPCEP